MERLNIQRIFRMLLWVISFYILIILSIYFIHKVIIFRPVSLEKDYSFQFDSPFEEVWLTTEDGEKINALYFPAGDNSKGIILYFHGNKDNLVRWGTFSKDFTKLGYDFFAIDYRGYGKSSGTPSEVGLYKDASAAYKWIKQKFSEDQIIIYGRSLGTGIASHLAKESKAGLLILETPYYSMSDVFRKKAPFLFLPFHLKYDFPNYKHLEQTSIPAVIYHGTKDEIIPYSSAIKLRPFLASEEQFITIEGGKHKNLNQFNDFNAHLTKLLLNK